MLTLFQITLSVTAISLNRKHAFGHNASLALPISPLRLGKRVDMATLFEPTASPRVYGVPPGVDFPKVLLTGLRERLHGQPPETLARIHLVVNSRRMKRRLAQLLHSTTRACCPPWTWWPPTTAMRPRP